MKLSNLGIRFIVDDEEVKVPAPDRPTTLLFNGKSMYILSSCQWGFVLEPDEKMVFSNLATSLSGYYNRKDLVSIIVDSPGFKNETALVKMQKVRTAIIARASKELGCLVSSAADWWIDQVLENESQSP